MKKNGYPLSTIIQLMKEMGERQKQKEVTQISMKEHPVPQEQKVQSLMLPFVVPKGRTIIKNLNKTLKIILLSKVKTRIIYTGQKLNSRFQIKNKINKKHKHHLYYTKCPEASCTEEYLGKTGCRIIEQVAYHTGKDKQ